MLAEYIQALLLIFAAEMGDKTQILAMMFATKYKTNKVLIGIFIGSLLNHGIAVAFGTILGNVIPVYILQMIAGIAFVGFALWTLFDQSDDEEEEQKQSRQSAIMVVAMAFFVGELGDKTQLTAITLSLDALFPVFILLGTVSGMLVTSGIGIFVGNKIGDRLPEAWIKLCSSAIFLTFGVIKLVTATPASWLNAFTIGGFIIVVGLVLIKLVQSTIKAHQSGELTPYKRAARALYDYAHRLENVADDICRGVAHCGTCEGTQCVVGFIRYLAKEIGANQFDGNHEAMVRHLNFYKGKFSDAKLRNVHEMNVTYLQNHERDSLGYKDVQVMDEIISILLDKD